MSIWAGPARPRHGRPGTRAVALASARHQAALMPWGPLAAGCGSGLAVVLAVHLLGNPDGPPALLLAALRVGFVPLVVAAAFLAADPHRALTGSLPAPARLTVACRIILALPVLVATVAVQFTITASGLAAAHRLSGGRAASLPGAALGGEAAAWAAVAIALAVAVARTRWADLGGAVAAPAALAMLGGLVLAPSRLLPDAVVSLTAAQRAGWHRADVAWGAIALAAALLGRHASRDPWLRARPWRQLARARIRLWPLAPSGTKRAEAGASPAAASQRR